MGLFDDTIRDAHRPWNGTLVRRATADEVEAAPPDEDYREEEAPNGMQTVFRFQKEGYPPGGFPKAPFQPRVDENRPPAGDPLSAGAEVESPEPPARNAGITHISVEGDRRRDGLATGQEERISPSEVAAAETRSKSSTLQSAVLSGWVDAESTRDTHKSEIPGGSEPPVSQSVDAFQSRLPGRGAPSEPPLTPPVGPPVRTRTAPPIPAGGESPVGVTAGTVAEARDRDGHAETARAGAVPAAPARPAAPPGERPYSRAPSVPEGAGLAEPASETGLRIGHIDVVVVAAEPPRTANPVQRDGRGFLSRNYLKRL